MKTTLPKAAWLKGYIVPLFVILGLLGVYYFAYVPSRKSSLTSHNFRLLADMSDQIKAEILGLAGPLTNYSAGITNLDGRSTFTEINKLLRNLALTDLSTNSPSSPQIVCTLQTEIDPPSLEFDYWPTTNSLKIHARTVLKQLIDPLAAGTEFTDVLVAEKTGKVIYQRGGSELRFTQLPLPPEAAMRSFATNGLTQSKPDFLLFSQPFQFSFYAREANTNRLSKEWIICGLVDSDTFVKRTLAIPYSWVIPIIIVILLLALGWPFLNLAFLGPDLNLYPRHLALLYFCGLSGCALLTVTCLMWVGYDRLEEQLDQQMESVANNMLTNFNSELKSISAQLNAFDGFYNSHQSFTNETNLLTNPAFSGASDNRFEYPFLTMAVWLDTNGQQIAKWTVREANTPRLSVKERNYFTKLIHNQVFTKTFTTNVDQFCIEPIYSRNTGENEAVLSMSSKTDPARIATIDTRFVTFFRPVLPVDFGFCVLDPDGLALFHSDEAKNLRENFFVECENDSTLRAAIQGRVTNRFDTTYLSKPYSLYVTPMPDLPWSLVVFRAETKVQSIQVETLSIVVILYLVALVFLFVVLVFPLRAIGRRGWMWPHTAWRRRYLALTVLNGVLTILMFALPTSHGINASLLIGFVLLLPLLAILWTWWTLGGHPHWAPGRALASGLTNLTDNCLAKMSADPMRRLLARLQRLNYRTTYLVAFSSLMFLSSVVPASLLFKLVYHSEVKLLVKRAQIHLAQDISEREQRIEKQYAGVSVPADFIANRSSLANWDCYHANTFESVLSPNESTPKWTNIQVGKSGVITELSLLRPLFHGVAKEGMAYLSDQASDRAWRWSQPSTHPYTLSLDIDRTGRARDPATWGIRISSKIPKLWHLTLLSYVLTLFALALAVLSAWRIADGFFWLKREKSQKDRFAFDAADASGWSLVLGASPLDHLKGFEELPWDVEEASPTSRLFPNRICITDFHHDSHSADANAKKLQLLQKLTSDPTRSIVVVSEVHPLNFTLDPPQSVNKSTPDEAAHASASVAWVQLLRKFDTCYSKEMTKLCQAPETDQDFRRIWATCSPDEKRILYQITQTWLVNPKQSEIPRLLARALIRQKPPLRIVCLAFGKWIAKNFRPEEVLIETPEPRRNAWRAIKGPLLMAMLICGLVFFATQKTLWDHTIALLPAFAAAVTGIVAAVKLLLEFKSKKASTKT